MSRKKIHELIKKERGLAENGKRDCSVTHRGQICAKDVEFFEHLGALTAISEFEEKTDQEAAEIVSQKINVQMEDIKCGWGGEKNVISNSPEFFKQKGIFLFHLRMIQGLKNLNIFNDHSTQETKEKLRNFLMGFQGDNIGLNLGPEVRKTIQILS